MLQSGTIRKGLAAIACVAAFGWLVTVTGVGLFVMNASSSQRAEATRLSETALTVDRSISRSALNGLPEVSVPSTSPAVAMPPVSAPVEGPVASDPAQRAVAPQPASSQTATVSTSGLRLRELPTTQGHVLETMAGGAIITVLDGAVERDGLRWVPVRVTGDKRGWVASDGLE
jgi:hypothetical protein